MMECVHISHYGVKMPIVAVTYSPQVGGSSVVSLKKSFKHVGSTVIDADYRAMMADISEEKFNELYASSQGRLKLFAHAKAKAVELLEQVDCLALPGNNAMIDPELFNQERDPTQPYDFSRTIAELALVHVAIEKGMPILGACGGHQVVAVYGGGEITDLNIGQLSKQSYMNYDAIRINKGTMIGQIFASHLNTEETFDKPYYEGQFFGAHSQRVSKLPKGFIQTSIASDDVTIESIESETGVPIITTQFHPEIGAKGLPEATFLYKRTQHDKEMNMKVFDFMNKAALAYNQKKSVNSELKQFKPADDGANIKPSQVKAHLDEVRKLKLTANEPVNISPEKLTKTPYSWMIKLGVSVAVGLAVTVGAMLFFPPAWIVAVGLLGGAALSVAAGLLAAGIMYGVSELIGRSVTALKETVGPVIASGMRGSIANGMTAFLVNELKTKEEAAALKNEAGMYDQPNDANSKFGPFFDKAEVALNPSPQKQLRDTPARIFTEEAGSEYNSNVVNEDESLVADDVSGFKP